MTYVYTFCLHEHRIRKRKSLTLINVLSVIDTRFVIGFFVSFADLSLVARTRIRTHQDSFQYISQLES